MKFFNNLLEKVNGIMIQMNTVMKKSIEKFVNIEIINNIKEIK